jgi:hypothetical protein
MDLNSDDRQRLNTRSGPAMRKRTRTTKTHQTKMKTKTLVFFGNDKGGCTKSTSCGTVADSLQSLGFTVRLASGDLGSNKTLFQMHPDTARVDIREPLAMDAFMGSVQGSKEDIVFFDLPGFCSDRILKYFQTRQFKVFTEAGIRLVMAVTLTQDADPVRGAVVWVETFLGKAEILVIANGRNTPEGQPIDLSSIPGGSDILTLAKDRVIEIPRYSEDMLWAFHLCKAVPRGYFQGGAAARELGLNPFTTSPWHTHHNQVAQSVSKHAAWLVGKPIPEPVPVEEADDPAANSVLARLIATPGL